MIERAVLKELKEATTRALPPEYTRALRSRAVWFRQACYIALAVNQAHRSGVYRNLTIWGFETVVDTTNGPAFNHVGGKTRGTYNTVQVPVTKKLLKVLAWYKENVQCHLAQNSEQSHLLFPHLNVWDSESFNLHIEAIAHIAYPNLLRGNHSRRHNVELGHDLNDENMLEGTNLRSLQTFGATPWQ